MEDELKLAIDEPCSSCLAYEEQIRILQREIDEMKAAIVDGSQLSEKINQPSTECKDDDIAAKDKSTIDSQEIDKTGSTFGKEESEKNTKDKNETGVSNQTAKKINEIGKMGTSKISRKPLIHRNRASGNPRFNTPRNYSGRPNVWSDPRGFNRSSYRANPFPASVNFMPVRHTSSRLPFSQSEPVYKQLPHVFPAGFPYSQTRMTPMPLKNVSTHSLSGMLQKRALEDPSLPAYFRGEMPLSDPRYAFRGNSRSLAGFSADRAQSFLPPTYMERLSGSVVNQNDFSYLEEEDMRKKADTLWSEYVKDLQR